MCHHALQDVPDENADVDDPPISETLYESFMKPLGAAASDPRMSKACALSKWKSQAGKPVCNPAHVPDKVIRYPHCASVCLGTASEKVFKQQTELAQKVATLTSTIGPASTIGIFDVVLAFIVDGQVSFVSLVEALVCT